MTCDLPSVSNACWSGRTLAWRFLAWRFLRTTLLVLVLMTSLLIALQRKLIYVPLREAITPAMTGTLAGRLTEVTVPTSDGLLLRGWLVAAHPAAAVDPPPQPLILYFQGNAAHRGRRALQFGLFSDLGCRVLIVDYRGYGENPGRPSEPGLYEDARGCWRYAVETLKVPPERIVLFGESLGGGVATALAAELTQAQTPPGGLVIRASFTSLPDAGAYHYPWLPVRWFLWDRFDSLARIPQVACPLLIMHGDHDRIIPFSHGERLFAAAPERSATGVPKQFVRLAGAGHNDIMHVAADQVEAALRKFLTSLSLIKP